MVGLFMHLSFPLRSAFLALPLEEDAKNAFAELQGRLRPWEAALRFQQPDTPHLTLSFWRELLAIEYEDIVPTMERIARRTAPFSLRVNGVDTFGTAGRERVLFLAVAFSPELATLKKLCPWPNPPDQPFHPHITLARITRPQTFVVHRKKIMKALGDVSFDLPVRVLRLYGIVDGQAQTPVAEALLQGAA